VLGPKSLSLEGLCSAQGIELERSWNESESVGVVTTRVQWNRIEELLSETADIAVARVELSDAEVRVQ
jgi:hypothetical protein